MKIVQILQKNFQITYICSITKYKNIYTWLVKRIKEFIKKEFIKVKFVCTVRKCTSLFRVWNQHINIPVAVIFDV